MSTTSAHRHDDGGKTGARGYRYQYLRTLEAVLAAMIEPTFAGVQVEGRDDEQKVDYALMDTDGSYRLAVQVKSVKPGAELSASTLFDYLAALVHDTESQHYLLETNAAPGPGASELAKALNQASTWDALLGHLRDILRHARAHARLAQLEKLEADPVIRTRMLRARITFDRRDLAELKASLREDIRSYRNTLRTGLGTQAAGFMSAFLTDSVFERASSHDGYLSRSMLEEMLGTDSTVVTAALGSRNWGLVVGAMPPPPDVHRPELMAELHSALPYTAERIRRLVTITGLSGIGKSCLTAGYVADTADSYDAIFWIAAHDQSALKSSFRQVLATLAPSAAASAFDTDQLRAIIHSELMRLPGRWALVFDNASEPRDLHPWLPAHGAGDIIITTINSAGPHGRSHVIPVAEMSLDESVQLLANRFAGSGDEYERVLFAEMADALGRWPLALEIGCGFMNACAMTIDEIPYYLAQLRPESLREDRAVPLGYPRTLAAAVHLSLRQIAWSPGVKPARDRRTAWGLLIASAYCAERQIPIGLAVLAGIGDRDEWHHAGPLPTSQMLLPDAAAFSIPQAIAFLRQFSIITRDADLPVTEGADQREATSTIALNHIVQELVRQAADTLPIAPTILDQLAFHLERWLTRSLDLGEFDRTFILFGHAAKLAAHLQTRGIQSDAVALFFGNLAVIYNMVGDSHTAEQLLSQELAHLTVQAEPNHFLITETRLALAQTLVHDNSLATEDQQRLIAVIAEILFYAQRESTTSEETAAHFIHQAKIVIEHTSEACASPEWDQLKVFCEDLSSRFPAPQHLALVADLRLAAERLLNGDLEGAEQLCSKVLSSDQLLGPLVEVTARRTLILCHAHQQKWGLANGQLVKLQSVGNTPLVHQDLLLLAEKLGITCCFFILGDERAGAQHEPALQTLATLLDWPAVRTAIDSAEDARHRDQMAVFDCVRDLFRGNINQAEETLANINLGHWTGIDADGWSYLWRMLRAATLSLASLCNEQ